MRRNQAVVGHHIPVAEVPRNQVAGLHILVEGVPRTRAAEARHKQERVPGGTRVRVDNHWVREDRRMRRWSLHLQTRFPHRHLAEEGIRAAEDSLSKRLDKREYNYTVGH